MLTALVNGLPAILVGIISALVGLLAKRSTENQQARTETSQLVSDALELVRTTHDDNDELRRQRDDWRKRALAAEHDLVARHGATKSTTTTRERK